jgi:hypothetical protein
MHPSFRTKVERGTVFFVAIRGEAVIFCPYKNVPELSEEA